MKEQYGVLSPNFGGLGDTILRLQRELFVVGAELATTPEARAKQQDGVTRVSQAMVDALGDTLVEAEAAIELPKEFVVPGETRVSAALEIARTTSRRAERRTVTLAARRCRDCRWPYPCVSEPPGGPPVGPRPGGGAGRGAGSHRCQAGPHPRAPSRRIDDRHARERNR